MAYIFFRKIEDGVDCFGDFEIVTENSACCVKVSASREVGLREFIDINNWSGDFVGLFGAEGEFDGVFVGDGGENEEFVACDTLHKS